MPAISREQTSDRSRAVLTARLDAPQVDGDSDQGDDGGGTEFSAQSKPSFGKRVRNWLVGLTSSGAAGGFLGYLTSWEVVAILCGFSLVVAVLIVWFLGPDKVRAWVARQVS